MSSAAEGKHLKTGVNPDKRVRAGGAADLERDSDSPICGAIRLFPATLSSHGLSSWETAVVQVSHQFDVRSGICEMKVTRYRTIGLRLLERGWLTMWSRLRTCDQGGAVRLGGCTAA